MLHIYLRAGSTNGNQLRRHCKHIEAGMNVELGAYKLANYLCCSRPKILVLWSYGKFQVPIILMVLKPSLVTLVFLKDICEIDQLQENLFQIQQENGIPKASTTGWLGHGRSTKRKISIFEGIVKLFVNNHDKKTYAEVSGVIRDVLLWYDTILFNQFFADHLEINNRICKLFQGSTKQFLELPSGHIEENLEKYLENLETAKMFS